MTLFLICAQVFHLTQDTGHTQLLLSALLGPWRVGVGFSLALLSPQPAMIATNCSDAGWQTLPVSLDMTLEARLQSPMPSGTSPIYGEGQASHAETRLPFTP